MSSRIDRRHTSWSLINHAGAAAATMAMLAVVARSVEIEEFGRFGVGYALATAGALAVEAGLPVTVLRHLALEKRRSQAPERRRTLVVGLVAMVEHAALVLAVSLVAAAIFRLLNVGLGGYARLILPIALLAVSRAIQNFASHACRGVSEFYLLPFIGPAGGGALAVTALVVLQPQAAAPALTLVAVAVAAPAIIGLVWLLPSWRQRRSLRPRDVREKVAHDQWREGSRSLRAEGKPNLASQVSSLVLSQSDIWLAPALLTATGVAPYVLAARVANIFSVPNALVGQVLAPRFADLSAGSSRSDLQDTYSAGALVAFALDVAGLAVFLVVGGDLLAIVFGQPYAAAFWLVVLLVLGRIADAFTGNAGLLLIQAGRGSTLFRVLVPILPACVVGYVMLGSVFGAVGLAVGATTCLVIQNGLMARVVRNSLGVRARPW